LRFLGIPELALLGVADASGAEHDGLLSVDLIVCSRL